jgi:hypothetical protein
VRHNPWECGGRELHMFCSAECLMGFGGGGEKQKAWGSDYLSNMPDSNGVVSLTTPGH